MIWLIVFIWLFLLKVSGLNLDLDIKNFVKMVFTAFLLDAQHLKKSVEKKVGPFKG